MKSEFITAELKAAMGNCFPATLPDPELVAIAGRRRLSPGAKRLLIEEADRCKAVGTLAAFLRSARIYPATLASWRKELGSGDASAHEPARRSIPRT
jgi:hypothetical protein